MIKRKDFANLYACGFMFASVCYKKFFSLENWKNENEVFSSAN